MSSITLMHLHYLCPDDYCKSYFMTPDRLIELIDCHMGMYNLIQQGVYNEHA